MSKRVVPLDVREDIQKGREPFSRIMGMVGGLHSDEALLLIVPFEPFPLCSVLARQGFSHESRRTGTGTWEVLFTRVAIDRVTEQSPAPPPFLGRVFHTFSGFRVPPRIAANFPRGAMFCTNAPVARGWRRLSFFLSHRSRVAGGLGRRARRRL